MENFRIPHKTSKDIADTVISKHIRNYVYSYNDIKRKIVDKIVAASKVEDYDYDDDDDDGINGLDFAGDYAYKNVIRMEYLSKNIFNTVNNKCVRLNYYALGIIPDRFHTVESMARICSEHPSALSDVNSNIRMDSNFTPLLLEGFAKSFASENDAIYDRFIGNIHDGVPYGRNGYSGTLYVIPLYFNLLINISVKNSYTLCGIPDADDPHNLFKYIDASLEELGRLSLREFFNFESIYRLGEKIDKLLTILISYKLNIVSTVSYISEKCPWMIMYFAINKQVIDNVVSKSEKLIDVINQGKEYAKNRGWDEEEIDVNEGIELENEDEDDDGDDEESYVSRMNKYRFICNRLGVDWYSI
jgi:hypothetical protein